MHYRFCWHLWWRMCTKCVKHDFFFLNVITDKTFWMTPFILDPWEQLLPYECEYFFFSFIVLDCQKYGYSYGMTIYILNTGSKLSKGSMKCILFYYIIHLLLTIRPQLDQRYIFTETTWVCNTHTGLVSFPLPLWGTLGGFFFWGSHGDIPGYTAFKYPSPEETLSKMPWYTEHSHSLYCEYKISYFLPHLHFESWVV